MNPNPPTTAITTVGSTAIGSPHSSHSSTKRLSRSRQAHDTTINYEQQQQQQQQQQQAQMMRPSSLRQMANKFDSMACFHQVSRLVISFSDSLFLA